MITGKFNGFFDYNNNVYFNTHSNLYAQVSAADKTSIYRYEAGNICQFNNAYPKQAILKFVVNDSFQIEKVFYNIEVLLGDNVFTKIKFESADAVEEYLVNNPDIFGSIIINRFYEFRNKFLYGSIPLLPNGKRIRGYGWMTVTITIDNTRQTNGSYDNTKNKLRLINFITSYEKTY